ncbi:MAG: acetylglutamate kinase [Pseudomonadota bacterium]
MSGRLPADQSHAIAATLIEALPYLRRFKGAVMVIKYGGHAMGSPELARDFARDVALLKQVGIHPVIVHGGGPQIKKMLERLNIVSEFVDGLRVTDAATVEIVEMVLAGAINKEIVSAIHHEGGRAVGISGKDGRLIQARKVQRLKRDPESNIEKVLDLGFVGEPVSIDRHILDLMATTDVIPVIAPIGAGVDGHTYNINADTAAGAIAGALQARKLLMLTDVPGVRGREDKVLASISPAEAHAMIADGTISGGMIPKIETCLKAVEAGVEAAVILDGRTPHAILLELFREQGFGTQIRT